VDGAPWSTERFYKSPEQFRSTFLKYTKYCDLLLHCSFWNPVAPVLFTKKDMQSSEFRISVIADISCDINGAVPATSRSSTIEQPFYGYNPLTEKEDEPFSHKTITIMAVDNLPCELPRDASEDFGKELFEKVMPSLLQKDEDGLIERATICMDGELMPRFHYLEDYAYLK
jgi:alanine dehydrogenase